MNNQEAGSWKLYSNSICDLSQTLPSLPSPAVGLAPASALLRVPRTGVIGHIQSGSYPWTSEAGLPWGISSVLLERGAVVGSSVGLSTSTPKKHLLESDEIISKG